ncbi:GNAT family N-acetyltransferase [Nonlabens sp. Ci31]|jgi:ribosomal protein S18 acetylase RimI-like enzyme|uniref:GNAT family N-acetyltransferase n=1 Tax=Nonlabens sp. Ci31 TaxID=2608253 RepID=UPI0014628FE4|nr:GNAT family N-acetyltransferase [Nonlabens sp. Ci31]QJP35476.1 GNAT family N-acetyltransferase [Nonlabens sp. Ci31]
MIKKLQNTDIEVSQKIHSVFQASYAVEAQLLKAFNFPPLKRPLENYRESKTDFFGFIKKEELAGVIEINPKDDHTRIASLVIDPHFFRQGIAGQLIEFVFNAYDSNLFIVETGLDNGPAVGLYKKFGFIEVTQWDTDFGIRKIRLERR